MAKFIQMYQKNYHDLTLNQKLHALADELRAIYHAMEDIPLEDIQAIEFWRDGNLRPDLTEAGHRCLYIAGKISIGAGVKILPPQ